MKTKNAYRELPEGYREDRVIDAKDKKTVVRMNVIALGIMIAVVALLCVALGLNPWKIITGSAGEGYTILAYLIFMITMVAYIILHELTHGAAYKLLTREKLTFGMTLTVAYCGVPDLYVNRKTALISVLAPFVVYDIVFGLMIALLTDPLYRFLSVVLLAIHISGCIGDLLVTKVLLFDYKKKDLLMNDTGPKQTFCVKE